MQQGNQPLKAIVVREGRSAQRAYLPLLRSRQDVELAGIYSRTLKAAASAGAAWEIQVATEDLGKLIERKPQVAFVPTPRWIRAEIAAALPKAGVDVCLEKPPTEASRETW